MEQGENFVFWGFSTEGPKWVILREAHMVALCPELHDDLAFWRIQFVVSRSMVDSEVWVITELETGAKIPWAYCDSDQAAIETAQVEIRNRGTLAIRKAIQRAKDHPGWFPLGESPREAKAKQEEFQPCSLPGDLLSEELTLKPADMCDEEVSSNTKKEYIPTYQELCTEIRIFNMRYPPGTQVMVEKDDGSKVSTRVKLAAMGAGATPVVWLENEIGCYAMDRVKGFPCPDKVDLFNDKHPVGSEVKVKREIVEDAKVMEPARWLGGKAVVGIRKFGDFHGKYGDFHASYKSLDSIVVEPPALPPQPPPSPYLSPNSKVDLFNQRYPVGSEVNVTMEDGSVIRTKVRAPAHFFEDIAGVWLEAPCCRTDGHPLCHWCALRKITADGK